MRGPVRRTTILTLLVCALALTAHWAFNFWYIQHLRNLPDLAGWTEADKTKLVSVAVWLVILTSIAGNFLAALLARWLKYRRAIAFLCLAYCVSMAATYAVPLTHDSLWYGLTAIGLCQGVFALFTMYLPPLFPTLLRRTGAGFCYNIGRVAAAAASLVFGLFAPVADFRGALLWSGAMALAVTLFACALPVHSCEDEPA